MSEENFDLNQTADASVAAEPQAEISETAGKPPLELMSQEELEALRNEAEKIYKEIGKVSDKAYARMRTIVNQLNELKGRLEEIYNLEYAYGEWFTKLLLDSSSENEFERGPEPNDETLLLRLSRELSRQQYDLEERKKALSEIDRQIEEEEKVREETRRSFESDFDEEKRKLKADLDELKKQIGEKQDELEKLKAEIEAGNRPVVMPRDPDSRTAYEAASIEEFTREGFALPENVIPTHIYLCGNLDDGCPGSTDITGENQVWRDELMEIDVEQEDPEQNKFRYMGNPQLVIKKMQSGIYKAEAQSSHCQNKVDGVPLTRDEDIELHQGSVIEMTDRNGKTQRVKVYIAN